MMNEEIMNNEEEMMNEEETQETVYEPEASRNYEVDNCYDDDDESVAYSVGKVIGKTLLYGGAAIGAVCTAKFVVKHARRGLRRLNDWMDERYEDEYYDDDDFVESKCSRSTEPVDEENTFDVHPKKRSSKNQNSKKHRR